MLAQPWLSLNYHFYVYNTKRCYYIDFINFLDNPFYLFDMNDKKIENFFAIDRIQPVIDLIYLQFHDYYDYQSIINNNA